MHTSAETPQRLISPPAEQPAPHARTLSKATVTSANLASVGETNLATSAVAGEKAALPSSSTPRRRPSFLDQQQQPTPRGSLQWPSTHRSFSSAAATRDSSCHSQTTDRVNTTGRNASAAVNVRGRAPSSTCHTPMSSRGEHSEHRSSAISGAGARRGHSLGPHPSAPPLVDVGDSASQGPQSASHSVYTTGLCTPRENTTATSGCGLGGCGNNSSGISATVNVGTRSIVTPAPPPLDDFEAAAQTLSRAELEEKVEEMRGENLVLRTSVLRLRESLATLQEGLRSNYADIERRQDSIANTLLRRLEATKRHRAKLMAHLRAVELEKVSQETKLQTTTQSISELSRHLKREEQEIAERLQGRLAKLHVQREQLDRVLAEQTSSLQQLSDLVQEVEEMGLGGDGVVDGGASGHTAVPPTTLAAAEAPANTSASVSVPPQATISLPHIAINSAPVAELHERSSSRLSVASSTAATTAGATTTGATTTTADVAYDPNAMMRYLEEEIAAAESLRGEAMHKADEYAATRERLERRLQREKAQKAAQASRTEALRQELRSASSAVNEKVASQEMALEMEVDRHLNSSRLGGDIVSSASSTCVTPKLRAMAPSLSRGNSVSPCASGLMAGPTAAEGDARPAVDSFLLPSSSFGSAVPASSAGHAELPGVSSSNATGCPTGMVVGDDVMPRISSSSMRINTSVSRDETTASSEGTPRATRLQVQDTSRMAAPRPATSAESTPRRTPLTTPQLSISHAPDA